MTIPSVDSTTLNNLSPNLDIGDVADPALRLAAFQYIYTEMQAIVAELNSLPTANFQNLSVTTGKIAELAVTTGKIAELAVTTAKLNDLSVTLAKMAANSVGTMQLLDLSIITSKLSDLSITTAKLAESSVTLEKMADNSVGMAELIALSVTNDKVANATLTADKFVPGALTNDTQNGLRITALKADTEKFAAQADFVDIVESRVAYKNINIKKVASDSFDVYVDDGAESITYNFIKDVNDDFYKINDCYFGGIGMNLIYFSDAPTVVGAWTTTTNNWYTTTIGDTFTVHCKGEQLDFWFFGDNRGGIFEFVIDGDTANKVTLSTYSTAGATMGLVIKGGLNPDTLHTVVGTFKGADPSNPPSGGTARGWVYANQSDSAHRTVNGYLKSNTKTAQLLSNASNKEMAVQVKFGAESSYVIPDHGIGTAFNVEPMIVLVDNTPVDLTTYVIGKPVQVSASVEIQQHCYGVIPVHGNVAEFWVDHHIDLRGKVSYSARFKALQNYTVIYSYPLMMPLSTAENTVLTSIGNVRVPVGDESDYYFEEEEDKAFSAALLSNVNKSYIAAGKLQYPLQSYRMEKSGQPDKNRKLYIWQRASVPKLYFRSVKDLPISTGEVIAWSGEIIVANIKNIYEYIT